MAQKIVAYYDLAFKYGGFPGKVKLAAKTCIGSSIADSTPDDPQTLALFVKALKELFPDKFIPT